MILQQLFSLQRKPKSMSLLSAYVTHIAKFSKDHIISGADFADLQSLVWGNSTDSIFQRSSFFGLPRQAKRTVGA